MNASKKKGTAWETAIVTFLERFGIKARREPNRGALDQGDLTVEVWPGVVIEAKNEKGYFLSAWIYEVEVEAAHAGAKYGVVWAHRHGRASAGDGYVIMTGATFTELMMERTKLLAHQPDAIPR